MRNDAPAAPNYPIESVDNALKVIRMFLDRDSLRVSEVGEELGVARSTAHRLMDMLTYHGFLRRDQTTRTYVAGSTLIDVGLAVVRRMDVRSVAMPHLQQLADRTGETVHLATLDASQVLYVACVEGPRALRLGNRVGATAPLHASATGKAMLSALPEDEARALLPDGRLPRFTKTSITSRRALEEQLAAIRSSGFATNVEENEEGLSSVASPIVDRAGRLHGAVAVGGPTVRLSRDLLESLGPDVRATADEVAEHLG